MKKHLALVLALVMVLTSFSFVSAAPDFPDVQGTVYEDAVNRLELLNVLKGYPDGTFRPEGQITRAEFAAVAVRISGLEGAAQTAQGTITAFSDVPAWHWASGYIGIAASTGIVNGIGNGLFAPEAPVKYEEAVTMLVRALGYEPEAQSKGGYPYGYLIVAEDIDLLDGLRGSLGVNATRGLVAQLTDNALEIPMMVSIGFGDNIRWVVSGTERTEKVYLIEKMGYEPVEGRVTSYSSSRKTVTLAGEGTFDVMDSFDYFETEGVIIKAWVNNDDLVVAYALQETVYFDAVAYDEENDIELITLEDIFEVDKDATLTLNGENVRFADLDDFEADFAKVVIDEDGYVIWAEGFNLDGFIVVEEVDDELLIAFDEFDELDVEDFTIVEDGKTIGVEGVEEGDIVFYNSDEEFAVVYNNSEMGVIDRAYTDSFRMDGTTYDLSERLDALYLEDGEMGEVTTEVLEEYVDEADDVGVFFDYYGDVVLISGDKGTAKTSTMGMMLELEADIYPDLRTGKDYLPLEGVNEEGVDVSFDANKTVIEDSGFTTTMSAIAVGQVIEYTVDEDGDLEEFATLETSGKLSDASDAFEITDRFAGGFRLKSSTVMFLLKDGKMEVDEVFTLADADEYFDEVTEFEAFSAKGVYADYIVVYESDATTDSAQVGVITRVRELANGDFEVTLNIEGSSYVFDLEPADMADSLETSSAKGTIVSFMINEEMDEIDSLVVYTSTGIYDDLIGYTTSGAFELENARDKTFILDGDDTLVYELDDAVVLDATGTTKTIRFSDIDNDDTVNVYYEGNVANGTVFVKYLVVVVDAQGDDGITNEEAAVKAVNDATTISGMQAALNDSDLDLDMGLYDEMTSLDKAKVAQMMLDDAPYADVAEVAAAFDTAVRDVLGL